MMPAGAETVFDLAIQGCKLLTPYFKVVHDATILVQGNCIAKIETKPQNHKVYQAVERLDGSGKLAIPGFIDGHTHAAQQLLRGSVVDELPMIWARILVPFESALTSADVYGSAMLLCVQNLKAGITCFADAGGPYADQVAEAVLKAGIRAVICRSTMDQGDFVPEKMKEQTQDAVTRTEELLEAYHGSGNGRIQVSFGIRSVMTSTPDLLEAVSARAKELDVGVHSHLAEHRQEVSSCLSAYGKRPAEWLDSYDLLGPNFIGAHSVLLSDREIMLIKARNANVVHCPRANLNSHGFSKTPLMIALGINIGLGTDGASQNRLDLFEQMRLLKYAMQARYGLEISDPRAMPTLSMLRMATLGGARAIGQQDQIGSLEVGKKADIVLLDLESVHISPTANLPSGIVLCAGPGDVRDVIVDGKVLVRNREMTCLDEVAIRKRAAELMMKIGARAGLKLPSPCLC